MHLRGFYGKELPEVQALFDKIASCLDSAIAFEGVIFRSVGTKYANETDFVSGDGAAYYGGRWNPPKIRAVYGSLSPATAASESFQSIQDYGFAADDINPRVIAAVKVKLSRLLNLTDSKIRRKIGFRLDELLEEDWKWIQAHGEESWTQAIGRGACLTGFEALLLPSASDRRGGKNVVFFPGNLGKGSFYEIVRPDELPPHPSHW